MKKALVFGLCLSLVLSLGACGNKTDAPAETQAQETESIEEVYAFNYDVEKLVTLGEYKGLTYTITDTTVTEGTVDQTIEQELELMGSYEEITDRAVEVGDVLDIDYEGILDGVAFDGGTAQNQTLEIGSGQFIDGFEDGLVGVMPGEDVSLDLTFPEEYHAADLAGKAVVFNVTVNHIRGEYIVPELSDEVVAKMDIEGVTTVDEYRAHIRKTLEEAAEMEAKNGKQSELFAKVIQNATVNEFPEELVAQYKREFTDYYSNYATMYGMSLEDFLSVYMDTTVEEFEEQGTAYGKQISTNMLVIAAIAKAEGIEITDDIYEEEAAKLAEQNGYPDADTLEAEAGKDYIKQVIMYNKVIDLITENGIGEEAAPETEAQVETEE